MLRVHHPQLKRRTRHPKNRRPTKNAPSHHFLPNYRQPGTYRNPIPSRVLLKRSHHRKPKYILPKHLGPITDPPSYSIHRNLQHSHNPVSPSRTNPHPPNNTSKRKQPTNHRPPNSARPRQHHGRDTDHLLHHASQNTPNNYTPRH